MGLFSKEFGKKDDVGDQLKILATNIEVLNQKLLTDPNMAFSPGEALIKKEIESLKARFARLEKGLSDTQANMDKMSVSVENMLKSLSTMNDEIEKMFQRNLENQKGLMVSLSSDNQAFAQNLIQNAETREKTIRDLHLQIYQLHRKMISEIYDKLDAIGGQQH